ncbi:hypothetical protein CONLIGDRAFT_650810 [Coniochaeta ligniaria NRRL 30616]|uniref:Uncharacterized protein n=1 Tax=Coniochaeta ligniaria NRRL 30616 TaxID=1408157 RepID=A0A1J7JVZ8_9PEZI|nr:hypothetical protein CONLIGDRAFT_650810 [Coniochaeta ligniaria NRRL 30616]
MAALLELVLWVVPLLWALYAPLALALERPVETPGSVYCGSLDEATVFTYGDVDDGGPGFVLRDSDVNVQQPHYYFLYENSRDTHPWKYALLNPGTEVFISLCPTFAGRLVRGNPTFNLDGKVHNLGTWVELSLEGPPSANGWADVSLLEGCDGAATIAAMDNSGVSTGFAGDLITGAPVAVLRSKDDRSPAIAKTVGEGASDAAMDYELSLLDPMKNASIVDQYKPAIKSQTGRFLVTMYHGSY